MVNFRLIPLGIALARAINYVLASVLSRVRVWMTAHAQAGSRAGSCYLAATPTYQRQCVLPGYSQPAPTPPDPLVRVARPSRQLLGMHDTSSAVGSCTSDTSAPYGGVSRRSPACQCRARLFLRPNSRVHKCSHLVALARMVAQERCCLSFEISAFADYRC